MDIKDTVKFPTGGSTADKQNDIMSTIMNFIKGQGGGLNGLISQFSSKGLGDVISSWVSTGKNQPVSPDQIENVLGGDNIKNMASKLGIDTNALKGKLSNLLPDVVDKLTPDGKVPEGDILSKGMEMLGGLFGKK